MTSLELSQRFCVAVAIGLLIGLERGWQARAEPEGERAAGLRTHALAAALGGVWGGVASLKGDAGVIALGLAFATFGAAIILFRYREVSHDGTFGATTVVAAMLAFALGAFAVLGDMQVAAATAVAVAALLALKMVLHSWLRLLTWPELRSGIVLLAMTVIVLPLLPNYAVDPWNALNPFEIWLLTTLIAAISFGGYVAIKIAGARGGTAISSVAGGMASSTAVTVTLSRLAKEHPEEGHVLLAGVLFAGATMMIRVLVVAGLVNSELIRPLAFPLATGAGVFVLTGATLVWKRSSRHRRNVRLRNPLDLVTVFQFGALFAVVSVLAKIATTVAGSGGAYVLAALSGIADVDAITLSMARGGASTIGVNAAAGAIALAVAVNTIAKAIMGWAAGGVVLGRRLMGVSVLAIAISAGAYVVGSRMIGG